MHYIGEKKQTKKAADNNFKNNGITIDLEQTETC